MSEPEKDDSDVHVLPVDEFAMHCEDIGSVYGRALEVMGDLVPEHRDRRVRAIIATILLNTKYHHESTLDIGDDRRGTINHVFGDNIEKTFLKPLGAALAKSPLFEMLSVQALTNPVGAVMYTKDGKPLIRCVAAKPRRIGKPLRTGADVPADYFDTFVANLTREVISDFVVPIAYRSNRSGSDITAPVPVDKLPERAITGAIMLHAEKNLERSGIESNWLLMNPEDVHFLNEWRGFVPVNPMADPPFRVIGHWNDFTVVGDPTIKNMIVVGGQPKEWAKNALIWAPFLFTFSPVFLDGFESFTQPMVRQTALVTNQDAYSYVSIER